MRRAAMLLVLLGTWTVLTGFGDPATEKVKRGNEALLAEKADEALSLYNDAALDDPGRPEILFNTGNAFYRMGKYPEASSSYRDAASRGDRALEAKAFYNIGNCLFQQGSFREAMDAYREAIERDPEDHDAKFNLEYTERVMKEMLSKAAQTAKQAEADRAQKEGQKSQGPSSEGEEKESQAGSQDEGEGTSVQENKPGEDQSGQESTELRKESEGEEGREESREESREAENNKKEGASSSSGEPAGEMSREGAERFLDAFKRGEELLMSDDGRRAGRTRDRVEKDW
ncbi:MAG: tetratricopeptide repeat protein [Candidatus Omnitrophica bacterium]|nr:tetratricopeptide repeat protein [Candidatus Omnitrophota bacterium]